MKRLNQTIKVRIVTLIHFDTLSRAIALFILACCLVGSTTAQTSTFTYQGSLNDGGSPANGAYDLQFKLFDALTGGTQIGSTLTVNDLTVTGGVFSTVLDFSTLAFPGVSRFLEISVRPGASAGAYTTLTPRQQITSTPYAIRSLSTATADTATVANGLACTGCVTSSQIGSLPAGNANYIQNTNSQQASANFSISGNGTAGGTLSANIVNATTQFNIGGTSILSAGGTQNLFAGVGAGQFNTGTNNAFFGFNAGAANSSGGNNSFFGRNAGSSNNTGGSNAFFGFSAGGINTSGGNNSFFGLNAGSNNTAGSSNTAIGSGANVATGTLNFATAIGAGATVSASNTVVIGRNLDTVQVPGLLAGSGAGLTSLNAGNISAGTLATARGGTGLSATGATGNYLRSDGTNWTSSALQAGDIPNGSTNYIQNRTTPQASTNFNISGNGRLGGGLTVDSGITGGITGLNGTGVIGNGFVGVLGQTLATLGYGIQGINMDTSNPAGDRTAVYGQADHPASGIGVLGSGVTGVRGTSSSTNGYGVFGLNSSTGYAGYFSGRVNITGTLSKGGGSFKIDHPLDPENKYLYHSFVESPDMMNIYNGNVTTDANAEAEITMPEWFESLNRDFRYQLTCIGTFAQAIVAEEIKGNHFKIKTSLPNVKVSWQVTGIRKDAWANQNRIPVEELKPELERGSYLHPEAFGKAEEKGVEWTRHPEMMKRQKEERERLLRDQINKPDTKGTSDHK